MERNDINADCKKEIEGRLDPIIDMIFSYMINEHFAHRMSNILSLWVDEIMLQESNKDWCKDDHQERRNLMTNLLDQKILPLLQKAPPKDLFKVLSDLEKEKKRNKRQLKKRKKKPANL